MALGFVKRDLSLQACFFGEIGSKLSRQHGGPVSQRAVYYRSPQRAVTSNIADSRLHLQPQGSLQTSRIRSSAILVPRNPYFYRLSGNSKKQTGLALSAPSAAPGDREVRTAPPAGGTQFRTRPAFTGKQASSSGM